MSKEDWARIERRSRKIDKLFIEGRETEQQLIKRQNKARMDLFLEALTVATRATGVIISGCGDHSMFLQMAPSTMYKDPRKLKYVLHEYGCEDHWYEVEISYRYEDDEEDE